MAEDTKPAQKRGRPFEPGNNANPGGRTRVPEEIKEMWRCATPKATQRLIEALDAEYPVVVPGGHGMPGHVELHPDWVARFKALEVLYNRQWGKPAQVVTGDDGGPIEVTAGTPLLDALKDLAARRRK